MITDLAPSAKILLVEDNVAVARSLETLLTFLGHRCSVAGSAEEAARLDHHAFDLALIDIVLPDADGFALADRLSAERPGIGIILMTGSPAHFHQPVAGFRRMLLKPFRPRELEDAIAHSLSWRQRADPQPISLIR